MTTSRSEIAAWRDHLTDAEAETVARAEAARAEWHRLKRERARIIDRAARRARGFAARHGE